MAPKRKAPKVEESASAAAMTENFQQDLQNLADKAQEDGMDNWVLTQAKVYFKTSTLLMLMAAYSNASYLALTPVYGSIPASVYHPKVVMGAAFVGWSGNMWLNRMLPFDPAYLLPIIALYIPAIQFLMYPLSASLTAHWGPLVTELVTLFPLISVSAATVATMLEELDLSFLPQQVAEAGPGLGSWAFYKLSESLTGGLIRGLIGHFFMTTRVGLEMLLGIGYSIFAPSNFVALAIPAMYHAAMLNTHSMSPAATHTLNMTLQADNWLLLDRKESLTGYISVVESLDQGYRVMRCDHSLLGGEWVNVRPTDPRVAEPIYGVFVMLEAARLVEVATPVPDEEAKALVV